MSVVVKSLSARTLWLLGALLKEAWWLSAHHWCVVGSQVEMEFEVVQKFEVPPVNALRALT